MAQRWKKSWFVLYPASQHGVARLEFFDCKDPAAPSEKPGTKRLDKKIVRLADCVSVAPASESGPKDGTATFCLETSDRSYLFAAQKQQSAEWVGKLCEIAFGVSTGGAGPTATWPRWGQHCHCCAPALPRQPTRLPLPVAQHHPTWLPAHAFSSACGWSGGARPLLPGWGMGSEEGIPVCRQPSL